VPTAVVSAKETPPSSVSLDASRSIVVYGGAVALTGSVSNAQADQQVTIMERRFGSARIPQVHEVASLKTAADGSFSLTARPLIRTVYTAMAGTVRSDGVPVNVRPRLRVTHAGPGHRFLIRALAIRSFVGRYGVLQRWNRRAQVWVGVRRIYFRSSGPTVSPSRLECQVPGAARPCVDPRDDAAEPDGAGLHLRLQQRGDVLTWQLRTGAFTPRARPRRLAHLWHHQEPATALGHSYVYAFRSSLPLRFNRSRATLRPSLPPRTDEGKRLPF
jgi:hypothetical protein